ncbi:4-nitrophenyl phosphatase [Pullulanibacillus pueri]|uniref:Haloacid dehalogenase n=1 Tax=Pullulanibacillus pueri TaxID=1437324 RepID=A0A8J2ZS81_9BACL|nr:TIGR01457 family HAD-type hydrolase [Pullulanibacillus pueri]MBM7680426.1 4-nitrophenyl phosphatase [Pullulanibacillus pueri]GGH75144.1 haloacid dehalogenase [Pullulanibacillus pueri]
MKHYKGYLIDLDGTMYRGTQVIEEAVDFIKRLKKAGLKYLFVTNNSTKTKEQVAQTLCSFGIEASPEDVLTTSMATVGYIQTHLPGKSVYFTGEVGLASAIKEAELRYDEDHPEVVVIGLDRQINYEKLAKATLAVRSGATFISTNPDVSLPTERGLMPGNGAWSAVVETSTGVKPIIIGKPSGEIVEQALQRIELDRKDVIMVGDNYYTDILAGIHAHVDTLLVYTGVTQERDLLSFEEQPTYTVHSLQDWEL